MSKKFKIKPDDAILGRVRPMAIEQDLAGLGKYRRLADNPIYYYNALQYTGGALYRAILGYDVIWDRKAEDDLMLCLDYYVTDLEDRNLYYFEELKLNKDVKVHGLRWPRGIAPRTVTFDLQWGFDLQLGESVTARVNLADKPNHVDIERGNGDVFTVPLIRYKHFRDSHTIVKGEKHESKSKQSKQARSSGKGRQSKSLSLVRSLIKEESIRNLSRKLSFMR